LIAFSINYREVLAFDNIIDTKRSENKFLSKFVDRNSESVFRPSSRKQCEHENANLIGFWTPKAGKLGDVKAKYRHVTSFNSFQLSLLL
jgi:hypothetical protein